MRIESDCYGGIMGANNGDYNRSPAVDTNSESTTVEIFALR